MLYKRLLAVVLLSLTCTPAQAVEPAKPASDTRQAPFTFSFAGDTSLRLYAAIDMLTYYDTTSPAISDWLAFVYPEGTVKGDEDSFNMAVRASKIGLVFKRPGVFDGWDLQSKLEMDFVGGFSTGSTVAYSPLMRLKQAWVSLDSKHLSFLAGQTFGNFGPLFPSVGSWIALGTSGNPWIRLPQLRVTLRYEGITLELSANRPMAANESLGGSQDDIISDGEYSNMPFLIGRLGYAGTMGPIDLSVGVSGAFGKEKIIRRDATQGLDIDTTVDLWMAMVDLKLATKYVAICGEAFVGSNLNTFYAGILQGVTIDPVANTAKGIGVWGMWAQLSVYPSASVSINAGGGIDNPDDADLGTQGRSKNLMAYANVTYKLTPYWALSLEGSYMETQWKGADDNDNIRALFRTTVSF